MTRSERQPEDDMRCDTCIAACIECPKGYFSGRMRCEVCGFGYVLCKPLCVPEDKCPQRLGDKMQRVYDVIRKVQHD